MRKRTRGGLWLLAAVWMLLLPACAHAQNDSVATKMAWWRNLHIDLSADVTSPSHETQPFVVSCGLNYTFAERVSVHFLAQGNFFVPKQGSTKDYNKAINLGGALGYRLCHFGKDDMMCGDLELRGTVTATVNDSPCKNTAYNVGFYWTGGHKFMLFKPIVGLGYSAKSFHGAGAPTLHGVFATIGLRL